MSDVETFRNPLKHPRYVPGHGLLAGRGAVVTAAAGAGIGGATARRLLEEGARVLISDAHARRIKES
jgi:3-oxoacyl-[acyl-carrier protein] reductase